MMNINKSDEDSQNSYSDNGYVVNFLQLPVCTCNYDFNSGSQEVDTRDQPSSSKQYVVDFLLSLVSIIISFYSSGDSSYVPDEEWYVLVISILCKNTFSVKKGAAK